MFYKDFTVRVCQFISNLSVSSKLCAPDDTLAPFPLCFVSIISLLFLVTPAPFSCLSVHVTALNGTDLRTRLASPKPSALMSLPPSFLFHLSVFILQFPSFAPLLICFTSCYPLFFPPPRRHLFPSPTADSFPGLRRN